MLFRSTLATLALTSLALGASACNTVKGLGRDIESVGEAGDRAMAKSVKQNNIHPA